MEKAASGDDKTLPIAYATALDVHPTPSAPPAAAAVGSSTASQQSSVYELAPGSNVNANASGSSGVDLTGCPVQIGKGTDPSLGLPIGLYVHSIQLGPDLEISHLNDPARAQSLLDSNIELQRRLVLDPKPPVFNPNDGFYYCHTLPTPASLDTLQFTLTGFPPRVTSVSPHSPLAGKLHPHQVVVAVRIPGKEPPLNEHTPGFTAYRVQQELQASAKVEGIQMVVKDERVRIKKEKGSSDPCSDCTIM